MSPTSTEALLLLADGYVAPEQLGDSARLRLVSLTGAVLVRPDGYVAWRCATSKAEPVAEIEMALSMALGQRVQQAEVR